MLGTYIDCYGEDMRRLICFILYAAMIGAGSVGLVMYVLHHDGSRIGLRVAAACGCLLLLGGYLLWVDFLAPPTERERH
jgi:hypothetical protein